MNNPFQQRRVTPLAESVAPANLNVKMTPAEAETYEWARKKMGLTRSDFARTCFSEKIEQLLADE